jgi:hypothetical protein
MKNAQSAKPKVNRTRDILLALYKFRFANAQLAAGFMGLQTPRHAQRRLKHLVDEQYIGRRYNGSDRIHGRPAIYYLKPKGISYLKTLPRLNPKAFNLMYKDSQRASDKFIERSLHTCGIYLKFKELYGQELDFFTPSEMTGWQGLPKPKPDGLIVFRDRPDSRTYFLELIDDSVEPYLVWRRLKRYFTHYDSNEWQIEMDSDYPSILILNSRAARQRRARQQVERLQEQYAFNLRFHIALTESLLSAKTAADKIWTNSDVEELTSL